MCHKETHTSKTQLLNEQGLTSPWFRTGHMYTALPSDIINTEHTPPHTHTHWVVGTDTHRGTRHAYHSNMDICMAVVFATTCHCIHVLSPKPSSHTHIHSHTDTHKGTCTQTHKHAHTHTHTLVTGTIIGNVLHIYAWPALNEVEVSH